MLENRLRPKGDAGGNFTQKKRGQTPLRRMKYAAPARKKSIPAGMMKVLFPVVSAMMAHEAEARPKSISINNI